MDRGRDAFLLVIRKAAIELRIGLKKQRIFSFFLKYREGFEFEFRLRTG